MAKNLKIKKVASGDNKGSQGIYDGDELVGLADDASMKSLAEELHAAELDELTTLRKMKTKAAESMAELEELRKLKAKATADSEELEELRKLKAKAKAGDLYIKHDGDDEDGDEEMKKMSEKLGITLNEVDASQTPQRKQEVACLREFAKVSAGDKSMLLAEDLLEKGRLTTSGYLRAQRIERLVDGAISKGKLLPKQRQAMYELAIADFPAVEAFLNDAKPVIDLTTRGFEGDGRDLAATEQLESLVVQHMSEKKVDRITALRDVTRKNPALWEQHTKETAVRADLPAER